MQNSPLIKTNSIADTIVERSMQIINLIWGKNSLEGIQTTDPSSPSPSKQSSISKNVKKIQINSSPKIEKAPSQHRQMITSSMGLPQIENPGKTTSSINEKYLYTHTSPQTKLFTVKYSVTETRIFPTSQLSIISTARPLVSLPKTRVPIVGIKDSNIVETNPLMSTSTTMKNGVRTTKLSENLTETDRIANGYPPKIDNEDVRNSEDKLSKSRLIFIK